MEQSFVYLKEIDWPNFGEADPILFPSVEELESRLHRCRLLMQQQQLSHLVIYADREHFGNLMYLTHFDPRFEEALLIISEASNPLLLVGNECVSHLTNSPLYNAGKLRYERYQAFSLINQPRDESRSLSTIFEEEGISKNAKVGCIGWKYYSLVDFNDYQHRIEIPSYIVDTLRSLCSEEQVVNASDILMSPVYGLKSQLSAFEIAHFEYINVMASEGMKRVLQNFKAGVTDFEMIKAYEYTGYPLGCHIGMKSSGNQYIGLSSPVGTLIKKGEPCSTNIAYWGSNICRAGWVAQDENDLPESAQGYIENFASPYFYACAEWLQHLKIGTKGKVFYELIQKILPFEDFSIFLNPGHLIHYEEWLSSPIYKDSEDLICSGMYFQLDIIPRSKKYFSSRIEDGYMVANEKLRKELEEAYPQVYQRCMDRRNFMNEVLGIQLPQEVLPLSNIPAILPPFFLNHKKVMSLKA